MTVNDKKGTRGGHRHRGCCCPAGCCRPAATAATDGSDAVCRLLCDVYADAAAADIAVDSDLVRFVLGRLHATATPAGRWTPPCCRSGGLGPAVSLFLRRLYDVSHRTCWHLDEWRLRRDRDELRSLGAFGKILCRRHSVQTADELLDAVRKGYFLRDLLTNSKIVYKILNLHTFSTDLNKEFTIFVRAC